MKKDPYLYESAAALLSGKRFLDDLDDNPPPTPKRSKEEINELRKLNQLAKFNSLPLDIMKKIFCYVDAEDLWYMKSVCFSWCDIIRNLLYVRFVNSEFFSYRDDRGWNKLSQRACEGHAFSSSLYCARTALENLINATTLNSLLDGEVDEDIEETDYQTAFKEFQRSFRENCYKKIKYLGEDEDIAWFFIMNMTGLKSPLYELKFKGIDSDFVKSFMTGYKWYKFSTSDCMQNQGIAVLLPDKRTFVIVGYNEVYGSSNNGNGSSDDEVGRARAEYYGFGCAYDDF